VIPAPLVRLHLPVATVSEANRASHESWHVRCSRAKTQRGTAKLLALVHRNGLAALHRPLTIVLTRIAPRSLDTDNLAAALKAVRDGLTDALRDAMPKKDRPKNDSDGLHWLYAQHPPDEEQLGVGVRIYQHGEGARALLRVLPSTGEAERWVRESADVLDVLLVREVSRG
jgi:hypothetical protein